jgi:hypothetical protein
LKTVLFFLILRKIEKNERSFKMKGGYFAGMLAGGLMGMVAAIIVMPYIRPVITNAMEKGKDFIQDNIQNMQTQK